MISKYDFMIDNNGDISFLENNNNDNRLRINFYKSNYKSIAIKLAKNAPKKAVIANNKG